MHKIGIIGAGNMGMAFYNGLIKHFPSKNLFICNRHEEKMKNLNTKNTFTDVNEMLKKVDIIIIAVKPQSFDELCEIIKVNLKGKLIISIMARVNLKYLEKKLKSKHIIHAMPNLAVQTGNSVTGWFASQETTNQEKVIIKKIFGSLGLEIEVQNDEMIASMTAIAGSGPAYFFYLTELLEKNAISLGFSKKDAKKIAKATFIGSALILENNQNPQPPLSGGQMRDPLIRGQGVRSLRQAVTSKGGTTESALNYMKENNFEKIFENAILKAKKKAEERTVND